MGVRKMGEFTYIFYPNGCERTCGTADVVTLENDRVIDAIVRWPGHHYSGQSSSPASMPPGGRPRQGADTLKVGRDSSLCGPMPDKPTKNEDEYFARPA